MFRVYPAFEEAGSLVPLMLPRTRPPMTQKGMAHHLSPREIDEVGMDGVRIEKNIPGEDDPPSSLTCD